MIGAFRARLLAERGAEVARALKVHTKFVPDWDALANLRRADVQRIVDRSLLRLKAERLDLVQFHWWNYDVPGHVDAVLALKDLQSAGKIDRIGGTNFDAPHTAEMIAAGAPLVSMQVQYSLLDPRAENSLVPLCARTGMKLLCYGVLAGGFIAPRWLGAPEPGEELTNRSLIKYKLIIDDFGGWALFQELLSVLAGIGARHGVPLSAVAMRWMLDRPQVAGVIIGARYAAHLPENLAAFACQLDRTDNAAIAAVLARRKGPLGDCFTLERDRDGRHGRIMKYNLNKT